MKRAGIAILIAVAAGAIGYSVFSVEQHLRATDAKISALMAKVDEATQAAKQEAQLAMAASQRATDAAARADVAAGARASAEQERDRAQAAQVQAEAAEQQSAQQANQAQTELQSLRQQRQHELDQMQEALSKIAETKRTPNGMLVVLPDSTFKFDFDSAELKPRNRELLSRVAGVLLASKGFGLSVFGYTDDVGSKEYNQKLSERRAEAVRDYLIQAGINPGIVNTKGYGKTNPRINAETEQARAINRRVEIAVTDSEISYEGVPGQ